MANRDSGSGSSPEPTLNQSTVRGVFFPLTYISLLSHITVEVTLDPDTAQPQLYMSDQKNITYKKAFQNVPYTEKRSKRKFLRVSIQGNII
ncbi:Hypothetical predicted protein, partial [Marmota monax]